MRELTWFEFGSVEELISQRTYRKGVYILWIYTEWGQTTLYVGQGIIHDRMRAHQRNEQIMDYEPQVFWAKTNHRDGIENYLRLKYKPEFGQRWPNVLPISINSPFTDNYFDKVT